MIYLVTAVSIDQDTGEIIAPPRTEEIDTETNQLFYDASSPWEVEDIYESFWNRLNPSWEWDFPEDRGKVKVISVEAI